MILRRYIVRETVVAFLAVLATLRDRWIPR